MRVGVHAGFGQRVVEARQLALLGVERVPGGRVHPGRARRLVDDLPLALRAHRGKHRARTEPRADHVHVEDLPEVLEAVVRLLEVEEHPSVVQQDVDASPLLDRRVGHRLCRRFVRNVDVQRDRLAAAGFDLLGDLLGVGVVDLGDGDLGAFGDEPQRVRAPQALAGAGDDGDLPLKSHGADASRAACARGSQPAWRSMWASSRAVTASKRASMRAIKESNRASTRANPSSMRLSKRPKPVSILKLK